MFYNDEYIPTCLQPTTQTQRLTLLSAWGLPKSSLVKISKPLFPAFLNKVKGYHNICAKGQVGKIFSHMYKCRKRFTQC